MSLIAISGKARSGKDTAGDMLVARAGYVRVSFAAPLYELVSLIYETAGVPAVKNARLMQLIGSEMRAVDKDVWVNIARNKIHQLKSKGVPVVVTDVRYPNELNMLRDEGFSCIRVTRANRPIDRDPNHESETALDDADIDIVITNDGTVDEYLAKVAAAAGL